MIGVNTQKEPFGFAYFGRHMAETVDCAPRFFQLRRSVDEYIMGVSSEVHFSAIFAKTRTTK